MAKFYEQYRDVLEANGYTVDENGCVRDSMGINLQQKMPMAMCSVKTLT